VIQVPDFFGDGAIAIEKNGGAECGCFRQDAPPATSRKSSGVRRLLRRRA
jgi:hypothetical protein